MWREIIISLLMCWTADATPKQICSYHDVIEYLNISSQKELLLYSVPKRNWESPLELSLDFTLVSILAVQEKEQVVTFYFWLYVIWTNDFLSWNPLDFCNISVITLPANMFWVPEIFIDERADENKYTASPYVSINSMGQIVFFQSHRLTSSCNLDVHAFPFDKQKCNLTVSASAYQDENILLKSVKTSKAANQDSQKYYMSNGEWKFEELRTIHHYATFGSLNCSTVIYEITMSRRSVFYVLVVIIPMFTLFLLDMAISYAFSTPGEKITFKMTLILQVTFLSLMLSDMLPATSDDPPTIAKFFTGIFVLLIFGTLENAFELYISEKKLKLPSLVACVNRFKRKEKKEPEDTVTYLGSEVPKENDWSTPLPLAESSTVADSLAFLKHLDGELQQNKKPLALEKGQDVTEHHENLLPVEKGLYYIRLILSLIFLAFIIINWTN